MNLLHSSRFRPRPSTLIYPFSNEHGAVLLRILLSSTLQRRKRSPKTEPFENALYSGAIWKRRFLKTLFSSADGENDAIWKVDVIKIDTTGRQTTRPWVSKMADRRYHVASPLIRVVVWTGENDNCGRKSFWKRSKTAPFSFMDRASVTVYVNVSD